MHMLQVSDYCLPSVAITQLQDQRKMHQLTPLILLAGRIALVLWALLALP